LLDAVTSDSSTSTTSPSQPDGRTCVEEASPHPSGTWTVRDIVYASNGVSEIQRGYLKQCLDIYVPRSTDGTHPVVIHFHGGGWKRGDRTLPFFGAPCLCQNWAEQGIVAVAPSYRTRNWELHQADCREAVQWVVNNIADYGGDPRQIYISGHSAGGNIAMLLLTGGETWLAQELRNHIQGVIAISGVYTLVNPLKGIVTGPLGNTAFYYKYCAGPSAAFRDADGRSSIATRLNNSPSAFIQRRLGERPKGCTAKEFEAAEPTLCGPTSVEELQRIPCLILNADWDAGLGADGTFLTGLMKELGATAHHQVIPSTSHPDICWNQGTYAITAEFICKKGRLSQPEKSERSLLTFSFYGGLLAETLGKI